MPREAVLRHRTVDVLVALDRQDLRRSINAQLCHAGYRVRLAGSAAGARLLVHEAVPDVMILDARLQEVDVFEFIAGIRDENTIPFFPVIYLAERIDIADRALEAGGVCVLKPVQAGELLDAVASSTLNWIGGTTWTSPKPASQPRI